MNTPQNKSKSSQLALLALLFFVLLHAPILSIFKQAYLIRVVPLIYVYIFFIWLGLIVSVAIVIEKKQS